jgi:hypothetical protein
VAKPITIPNTFAAATSAIPLSQLDQDFSTLANSTNDLATYSNYVADTGSADAFIANYPANTNTGSLTTGLRLQFKAANANTGASTLNVQVNGASIGTASIRLTDGSALPANTIVSGAMVDVMYDGTNFQLMNDPSGGQEVITNLTLSGNLTVTGTSNFTGNVTANVANTTTSTITNLSSGNVTITGGTISNVTLDNVTVDVETFSNITINGTATFAAGTVSAPSITTSGDTNTGIYFPAADMIAFAEGGVEAMRIDSDGDVGIGTNNPATRLVVQTTGDTEVRISTSQNALGQTNTLRFSSTALSNAYAGGGAYIQSIQGSGVDIYSLAFGTALNSTTATERMRITGAGDVGIGTSSPSTYSSAGKILAVVSTTASLSSGGIVNYDASTAAQDVGGVITLGGQDGTVAARAFAAFKGGKENATSGNYASYASFATRANGGSMTERMRITSTGDVGIGTSSPDKKLVLAGSNDTSGENNTLKFLDTDTTTAAGQQIGKIEFVESDGGNETLAAYIQSQAEGTSGAGNLILGTGTAGVTATERMRITSAGEVLIGTTTSLDNASGVLTIAGSGSGSTSGGARLNLFRPATDGVISGSNFGVINFYGADTTGNTPTSLAYILSEASGTHTAGDNPTILTFGTTAAASSTTTERMRIDSSGNVGIGTTSPLAKLTAADSSSGASTTGLVISNPNSAVLNTAARLHFDIANSLSRGSYIECINTAGANNPTALVFATNAANATPTERMRITSAGDVGIGTSSPAYKLHVSNYMGLGTQASAGSGAAINFIPSSTLTNWLVGSNYNVSGAFEITPSTAGGGSTFSTPALLVNSSGNVGIGTSSPSYELDVQASSGDCEIAITGSTTNNAVLKFENVTTGTLCDIYGDNGKTMVFRTNGTTERMRITSGGEVYIAGTTDQGAYNLQVNGTGVWGAGAYVNGSDERIKDNISPIESGLDVVEKLNPVTYRYKEEWSKDQSTQTGFIAQELLTALEGQVYVDGVVQQGGEYMSVAYQNIIPILTKAIQELNAKVVELEAKLNAK